MKTGRPVEMPDRVKFSLYLSRKEFLAVTEAATEAEVSASAWVRAIVLKALKRRSA